MSKKKDQMQPGALSGWRRKTASHLAMASSESGVGAAALQRLRVLAAISCYFKP
jgi:hypothetical protein